jgi:hypothetical protein
MVRALTEVVHAAGSYVSFGGMMMMVYYDAGTGRVYFMDAQYNCQMCVCVNASVLRTDHLTEPLRGRASEAVITVSAGKSAWAR